MTGQANQPPLVELVFVGSDGPIDPLASITIRYIIFDPEEDVAEDGDVESARLRYELYIYHDDKLATAQDVRFFGNMIANEFDVTHSAGTGDFNESSSTTNIQDYSWDDPGQELRAQGFMPPSAVFAGQYFLYLVADDGVNEPVFTVSDSPFDMPSPPTAVEVHTWGEVKHEAQ